jgi:hypothetical protein
LRPSPRIELLPVVDERQRLQQGQRRRRIASRGVELDDGAVAEGEAALHGKQIGDGERHHAEAAKTSPKNDPAANAERAHFIQPERDDHTAGLVNCLVDAVRSRPEAAPRRIDHQSEADREQAHPDDEGRDQDHRRERSGQAAPPPANHFPERQQHMDQPVGDAQRAAVDAGDDHGFEHVPKREGRDKQAGNENQDIERHRLLKQC